jgi:hypothetical protein
MENGGEGGAQFLEERKVFESESDLSLMCAVLN